MRTTPAPKLVDMFLFTKKAEMVTPEDALPGRETPMQVPERHEVLGTPLQPPFPEGMEQLVVGMGCFWGAERVFWQADGVYTTAVGYAGGYTPNPTYEEVCSGRTGHTEAVLVVFDPAVLSLDGVLRLFWEGHDPTQGQRQGNDVGHAVPLGGLLGERRAAGGCRVLARDVPGGAHARRLRRDHDGDRGSGAVLLRGAVPPAVPREEPERLLRSRRHRRLLSGRAARVVVGPKPAATRGVLPQSAQEVM